MTSAMVVGITMGEPRIEIHPHAISTAVLLDGGDRGVGKPCPIKAAAGGPGD